jgi:hypothetical protein
MADFSLEGLLGNIGSAFSGGGNYLDEYLTPEQRAAMQRNAMLAASAALLKAGGESTRRIGIGEALGGAFEAGQAGYEKAQTGALTQMAMKQKMEEAKRAKALNAQIAGIIGTPTENESPDITANKLMQAGRAAMAGQDFTRGFDFYKQAREVNPRDEVQGAPFEGTDAQGNPIMLQQMKGGAIRPISGYGVKQGTIGQPFEVSGPDGKPMLVQQLPNGTLREVSGVSAKQAAPSQPFEVTGPDGKPMLVQQLPNGTLREVTGATPKQAAPSQPFEVTGPDGKPMLVQQMPDGRLREVSGVSPKQAAPGEPFEVTGPDGKPLLVQKMPDGSLREVSGFAPKLEAAMQPFEVTGPDGKPLLVTPQRGGGYTPVVGIGPKQNLSDKSKQLAELGLPPTLENFQLLESSPNEIKLLNKMGMVVNMANVERLRRAGAASTVVNMNEGQKGFENEMKIASAFKGEQIYKDFNDMRTAYGQVISSLDAGTPIGDVAGATKVMKLLDPGSVVRESELGIAMAAGGRMDRLKNYFNNFMTGQKLTPIQRQDFKALSNELYAAAGQAYNQKRNEYLSVGQIYNFPNMNTVLGAPANVPSVVRQPPQAGGSGLTWDPAQKKFVNR